MSKHARLMPALWVLALLIGAGLACGRRERSTAPAPQAVTVQPVIVVTQIVQPTAPAGQAPESPTESPGAVAPPAATDAPPPAAPTEAPPPDIPNLPVIDYFRSEPAGEANCWYLHWDLHGATAAYLNGQGVTSPGSAQVCPEQTSTYTLRAENAAGSVEETLTLEVGAVPEPPAETAPPSNLQGEVMGGEVAIVWTDATGETGYMLALPTGNVELPADQTWYTWQNPPCGAEVNVTLTAMYATGGWGGTTARLPTPACAAPDLVVVAAEVFFDPSPVVRGQKFRAHFQIANRSDTPAGPFTVVWHFHEQTGLKDCCTMQFDGLAARARAANSFKGLMSNASAGSSPSWVEVILGGGAADADGANNRVDLTLNIVD